MSIQIADKTVIAPMDAKSLVAQFMTDHEACFVGGAFGGYESVEEVASAIDPADSFTLSVTDCGVQLVRYDADGFAAVCIALGGLRGDLDQQNRWVAVA